MKQFYILFLLIHSFIATITFEPYLDIIDNIDVVPYSHSQKVQVAQSILNLFEIYVNLDSKVANYPDEDIDPKPRVQELLGKAASLSDIEFHYKMVDIFMSLRDFHTRYFIPGPHGCVEVHKAIKFGVVEENGVELIIAEERGALSIQAIDPAAYRVKIGDQLLSIDGMPIEKMLSSLTNKTGGANQSGGLRSALLSLSSISGRNNKLPLQDYNSYKFKSHLDKKVYNIDLLWIASTDNACWSQSRKVLNSIKLKSTTKKPRLSTRQLFKRTLKDDFDEDYTVIKKSNSDPDQRGLQYHTTADPNIWWSIYLFQTKNLGIITIDSFISVNEDVSASIRLIRDLLLNELRDTSALLFDVRSNGGGLVTMGNLIPQLFAGNINNTFSRALVSPINKKLLLDSKNGQTDPLGESYRLSKAGERYSPLIKVTEDIDANRVGQVYIQPVGVFTTGECYSTCDIFVANMKDNKIVTIFGEDYQSGGGGASPMTYNSFLSQEQPKIFPQVPFLNEMPQGAQDFKVAWTQYIRLDGRLIEDLGVVSDHVIRPSINDIKAESQFNSQFDRISDILNRQAKVSGRDKMKYNIEPQAMMVDIVIGQPLEFHLQTLGFSILSIKDDLGKNLAFKSIKSPEVIESVVVIPTKKQHTGLADYNILLYDNKGKIALDARRTVRYTPSKKDYLVVDHNSKIDLLSQSGRHLGQYEVKDKIGMGWNRIGHTFIIGDGHYCGNEVDTSISYFLSSSHAFKIHIKAVHETELNRDFFTIGYVRNGIVTQLIRSKTASNHINIGVSGKGRIDQDFDIPAGNIEFMLNFSSDMSVYSVGVVIKSIIIH